MKNKFPKKFCTFTGRHGGNHRSLCTYGGGHSWRTPAQNNRILCGRVAGGRRAKRRNVRFSANLGSRSGSKAGRYTFQVTSTRKRGGSYTNIMVQTCRKLGMKPVCDHPSYCRRDRRSLYVGQAHHFAHKPHRNPNGWWPSGWAYIKNKFPKKFCTFTGAHGGNHRSLCTYGGGHSWRTPAQNNRILCGVVAGRKRRRASKLGLRGGKTVALLGGRHRR